MLARIELADSSKPFMQCYMDFPHAVKFLILWFRPMIDLVRGFGQPRLNKANVEGSVRRGVNEFAHLQHVIEP